MSGATPVLLRDVATVQIGRRCAAASPSWTAQGEVAGGVVVMRSGKNARTTIEAVKAKLEALKPSLPPGVEVVPTYDRSLLIDRAVDNLRVKLIEEFIVVALVCAVFLFHLRSALRGGGRACRSACWPRSSSCTGRASARTSCRLGGIAIALGAMVDAVDRAGRERAQAPRGVRGTSTAGGRRVAERWESGDARRPIEVGPALFFSLLVITLSFVPVFTLEAQEGRLFSPLAFTKTYAMAAAAGLSVTLVPVLMGYLIRGRIPRRGGEPAEPLS